MSCPAFDPKELEIIGEEPRKFGPPMPQYNYPASGYEAVMGVYKKHPLWQIILPGGSESALFIPSIIPDNAARGVVFDVHRLKGNLFQDGGKDMFGVEWEYVKVSQGAMVRPGQPMLEDASGLKDVVWPDIESWDWEGCQKENAIYLSSDKCYTVLFLTGWFERLISLLDFEGALVALIDEDQKEDVHAFFDKLTDLYIDIFEKYIEYFPQIALFCVHDDWGSQRDSFFSAETIEEMIVPYMRRVTDFLHAKGKICDLHSCGKLDRQVPNMIKAGWDSWTPQKNNDMDMLYEKFGDRIILGIMPEMYDPENTSEEEQRAFARKYAEKYCNPDKPTTLSSYAEEPGLVTRAFREELYIQSRVRYAGGTAS